MDIKNLFIKNKIPDEFIYSGIDNTSIFRRSNSKLLEVYSNASSFWRSNKTALNEIKKELAGPESGIILSSSQFIFNLLTFDKLPRKRSVRKDLIDWKIQKLFPEMMENYHHEYFKLSKDSVLSVLLNAKLKTEIEKNLEEIGIISIYFGCSAIELINNIKNKKVPIDFFVESNRNQLTLVFIDKFIPYYIRKIRFFNEEEGKESIIKTIKFVENNYSKNIKRYTVFIHPGKESGNGNVFKIDGIDKLEISSPDYFFPK